MEKSTKKVNTQIAFLNLSQIEFIFIKIKKLAFVLIRSNYTKS